MDESEEDLKKTALIIAALSSFLAPFMISAVNIALPKLAEDLSANAVELGWISTAYLLSASIFLVPVGRLADIYGRKKIYSLGISIYTLSAFFLANSQSLTELIIYRIIEGIGAAMIFSTGVAILSEVFPRGERGKALGINVSAIYLGLTLGPFLGGFLAQNYGWRSLFYVNIPVGLTAIALIRYRLRCEWAESRGERFDYLGAVLYLTSFSSFIYGLLNIHSEVGILSVLFSLISGILFLRLEAKIRQPMLNLKIFRKNKVFLYSSIAALISYGATFAVGFLLSIYLQYVKKLDPQQAGIILTTQAITQAVFSPIAGHISDRFEPRFVASIGMFFTAAGLYLYSMLSSDTEILYIIFNLFFMGVGFALFSSPNTNAAMTSVQRKHYGTASAVLATMRLSGQMISIGIATTMFSKYLGNVEISPENINLLMEGIKNSFTIFSILCLAGVSASLGRGKIR